MHNERQVATGQEWPVVCLDRMKGEGTGRTNRHRVGVAGPDWQNPEGLGRVGSPRDHACAELAQQSEVLVRQSEDFECSIGRGLERQIRSLQDLPGSLERLDQQSKDG